MTSSGSLSKIGYGSFSTECSTMIGSGSSTFSRPSVVEWACCSSSSLLGLSPLGLSHPAFVISGLLYDLFDIV